MKWTTKRPTVHGWYWVRRIQEDRGWVLKLITYVYRGHTGALFADIEQESKPRPVKELGRYEWAGPIPEPDPESIEEDA